MCVLGYPVCQPMLEMELWMEKWNHYRIASPDSHSNFTGSCLCKRGINRIVSSIKCIKMFAYQQPASLE